MAKPPPPEKEPKICFFKLKVIYDGCDRPYLVRFSIFEIFGYSLKFHVILRSDDDRALHDHPWSFWTLMLAGGYWEETFATNQPLTDQTDDMGHVGSTNFNGEGRFTISKWIKPGSLRLCKSPHPHRLKLAVTPTDGRLTPALTLVFMLPKKREWGFYTKEGWLKWFMFNPNRSDCE